MFKKIFIFIFLLQSLAFAQDIPPRPNPPRLVNDLVGGLLSQSEIDALERKLTAYNDSTSTQITVVIVKSVQPYEVSDYAFKLGRAWGVGQKGKNNGLVLLWAPGDRKIFIATGYGMEGSITDARSKRIVEEIIKPNFRQLKYFDGLNLATDKIIEYASGEYDAEPSEGDEGDAIFAIIFFIILIIIVIYFFRKGGKGGGGGGSSWIPYTTYTGWGSSSGGWSSGGSDSGGGFGGFGGGDFGGGGASDDF